VSTRELFSLFSGLAVAIALGYGLGIEPRSWGSLLLVVPMLITAFAVDSVLDLREKRT
jgi:hypothetical protein